MEMTRSGIAAVVIPALLVMTGNVVDAGLKWRSDTAQREYDRQTRVMDKILAMSDPTSRIGSVKFYLKVGAFNDKYQDELLNLLAQAKHDFEMENLPTAVAAAPAPPDEMSSDPSTRSNPPVEIPYYYLPPTEITTENPKTIDPDTVNIFTYVPGVK